MLKVNYLSSLSLNWYNYKHIIDIDYKLVLLVLS